MAMIRAIPQLQQPTFSMGDGTTKDKWASNTIDTPYQPVTSFPVNPPVVIQPYQPARPTLLYCQHRAEYYLECNFEFRDTAKSLGFNWDHLSKRWRTQNEHFAINAIEYATPEIYQRLLPFLEAKKAEIEKSRAHNSTIEPPSPVGLDYLGYQKAGIAYALEREGTLIGDEMGLGKTIQGIGLINLLVEQRRTQNPNQRLIFSGLIIPPASLKLNWAKELHKWLDRRITYAVVEKNSMPRGADILIINYDMLTKYLPRLKERDWDIIICDEFHYCKNTSATRTKNVHALRDKAKIRIGLTGSPMPNRPKEIFPLVHWLNPTYWNNESDFIRRYCGGPLGTGKVQRDGASNLDELNDRLRSSVMIRRMKKDVLTELPDKRRQIIEFPLNLIDNASEISSVIQQEKYELAKHESLLQPIRDAMNKAKEANDTAAYARAVEDFRKQTFVILGQISTLRKKTAIAKLPLVIEHLEECIASSYKVVVFAHHHAVMSALANHFGTRAVSFHGEMKLEERENSVTQFQTNSHINLFIGSLTAAGVGITLTASSHAVFAELDWVPGNVSQAEDRLHRIGQKNSVLIQHLVLEDSLDYKIATQLIAKQEIIEQAIND